MIARSLHILSLSLCLSTLEAAPVSTLVANVNGTEVFVEKDAPTDTEISMAVDTALLAEHYTKLSLGDLEHRIDRRIDAIARESFDGDRKHFIETLGLNGIPISDYRRELRYQTMQMTLSDRLFPSNEDKQLKNKLFDDWLSQQRKNARIEILFKRRKT